MTKPAVWVQFIIKENNGGENNLLHLKYPTCRKLWLFLFFNYKDLRSQIVLSHPYPQLRLICGSFEFRSNYRKTSHFQYKNFGFYYLIHDWMQVVHSKFMANWENQYRASLSWGSMEFSAFLIFAVWTSSMTYLTFGKGNRVAKCKSFAIPMFIL